MWLLIILICVQSVLLVAAQTLLKISLIHFGKFSWFLHYFKTVFTTWQFAASGICALGGMLLWIYVLKKFEFSIAYPLLSVSYILGLFAAQLFFNEIIPWTRWVGVVIIIIGVFFVVK